MSEELTLLPCPLCQATAHVEYHNGYLRVICEGEPGCPFRMGGKRFVFTDECYDWWNNLPRALTWTTEPQLEHGIGGRMKIAASLGTSIKMEPSPSLCRSTAYHIKNLVDNGLAPSTNPANRSSPNMGFSFSGGEHEDPLNPVIPPCTRTRPYNTPAAFCPAHDHRGDFFGKAGNAFQSWRPWQAGREGQPLDRPM